MHQRYLLAADVGGAKADFALATVNNGRPVIVAQCVYASRDFGGLDSIIADFLGLPEIRVHGAALAAACFSVAGPVHWIFGVTHRRSFWRALP